MVTERLLTVEMTAIVIINLAPAGFVFKEQQGPECPLRVLPLLLLLVSVALTYRAG